MMNKLFIVIFLCSSTYRALAVDATVLYQFNQQELAVMNVQSLADLLRRIPLLETAYIGHSQEARLGQSDLEISAIYKDGLPLFMDMNTHANYQSISLSDIVRVELRTAGFQSLTKGITAVNIYMYSQSIHESPSTFQLKLSGNELGEGSGSGTVSLSNVRHSFGLHFAKQFENGLSRTVGSRAFDWASFDLGMMGVRYRLQMLGNSSLNLQYNLQTYAMLDRYGMIEGTSRTVDRRLEQITHRLNGSLQLQLSRSHQLQVNGQFALDDQNSYSVERDLSSGFSEVLHANNVYDSISHRFTHLNARFQQDDSTVRYSYGLGLEFTHLGDNNVSSVNAITVGYYDYALRTSFSFRPLEKVSIGVGLNYLSNSVMGNALLPRFEVQFAPSAHVSLTMSHLSSVSYPLISQLFYGKELTHQAIDNNLQLQMAQYRSSQLQLLIKKGMVNLRTGVIYATLEDGVAPDLQQGLFVNSMYSSHLINYLSVQIEQSQFNLGALLVLQGINATRIEFNQFFYTPEFNVKGGYTMEKWGTAIHMIYKWTSKGQNVVHSRQVEQLNLKTIPATQFLDVAVSQKLFNGKLQLSAGVTNFFDAYELNLLESPLNSKDPRNYMHTQAYSDRGQRAFVQLKISLN